MQRDEVSPGDLRRQMDSDLAHRSTSGGFVYLGFLAALWVTTDYYSTHPVLLTAISATSVACSLGRFLLGHYFARFWARNPVVWRAAYFLAVNVNILAWGLFLATTFLLFGYFDWKTLLLLICMAGTAPIAMAAFKPSLAMIRTFLFAVTTPMILANVYTGGRQGYTMAMVFVWYLLFALMHAGILHRQYVRYTLEKFALAGAKQAAEDADRAKSEFLANMGHELRTPLNAILGMTHLALNSSAEDERRRYLQMVQSGAEALLQMLNGLLDFSKIHAGKLELESVRFAVRELADEALRSFSTEIQSKGLTLRSHIDNGVPRYLVGDPLRLRQVLVNVVGNAVKFTARGEIEFRIKLLPDSSADAWLQFTVRDTGIGIAPDKQMSVFKAFEQADSSTTRRYGGTGLGLAIASRIVAQMGGRMWVESRPGDGSSFHWTARFETAAGQEQEPAPEAIEAPAKPDTPSRLHILVAEDHEIGRELLKKLLEMRGYSVTVAMSGHEVLRELQQRSFDLILMDIHMPELDGLSATAEIRRKEGDGRHIPIIALTAEFAPGLRERYAAVGITDYLAKPVKAEKLFEMVERVNRSSTAAHA